MSRAVLSLEIPDDIWMGSLSRAHPAAEFRVTAVAPCDEGGVAIAEIRADAAGQVVADLADIDPILSLERLQVDDDRVLIEIETERALFLEAARTAGIPIRTPFSISNGTIVWELTASRDRLSALGDTLRSANVNFTVESIYEQVDSQQLLTDRQWTIVQTALDSGYYDTPRTCTQEELASEVGLAKSTCSDLLHRAEEKIIKRLAAPESDGPGRSNHVARPV
ncbi:MAG: helix-turn-helix domain-containing protein [Halococcoides sp.]